MAISRRLSGLMLDALAFPPFNPPNFPNATAAGFFSGFAAAGGSGGACPVACWTTA
ncbi:MAG: hypothetical protein KIT22_08170 [Verrucomicrobiae bacterium]|nr:hypothetical protein [Verrucomicrobiae bacterium]